MSDVAVKACPNCANLNPVTRAVCPACNYLLRAPDPSAGGGSGRGPGGNGGSNPGAIIAVGLLLLIGAVVGIEVAAPGVLPLPPFATGQSAAPAPSQPLPITYAGATDVPTVPVGPTATPTLADDQLAMQGIVDGLNSAVSPCLHDIASLASDHVYINSGSTTIDTTQYSNAQPDAQLLHDDCLRAVDDVHAVAVPPAFTRYPRLHDGIGQTVHWLTSMADIGDNLVQVLSSGVVLTPGSPADVKYQARSRADLTSLKQGITAAIDDLHAVKLALGMTITPGDQSTPSFQS